MSNLMFAFPERIHLIWLAGAFIGLAGWLEFFGLKKLEAFISATMGKRLICRMPLWRRAAKLCLMAAFLTLGILALMRPQSSRPDANVWAKEAAAEIMVVLDVSRSMLAEDAAPNRLERAKAELRDLARELVGHRMGLIAFAGRAAIMSPMTADRSFFQLVLSGVDANTVSKGGTRIGDALLKAVKGFTPGPGAKVIVLITDGEDHDSFPMDAAKEARDRGVKIVTIGFGSETGSRIIITDNKTGEKKELTDRLGTPVISKLDGAMLRDIALATEGVYVPAGVGVLDLESILKSHIAPLIKEAGLVKTQTVRSERYSLWLSGAFLSLILAVWIGAGRGKWLENKALGNKAGMFFAAFILVCSLTVAPVVQAQDNPHESAHAKDSAKTDSIDEKSSVEGDKEGPIEGLVHGEPQPAEAPKAPVKEPKDERTPREIYNDALAALENGNFDEAEKGFLKARDLAGADGELRFRAAFNLGSSYSAKADSKAGEGAEPVLNELRSAAAWFRDAIRLREGDEDARVNLEIILKRIQQLADQLNQGENGLEPRLDRLIVDQRDLRNQLRNLMQSVHEAGADADPVAFESTYHSLSTRQRELLADSDAAAFMADEEIGNLESAPEEERAEKDAVRLIQLQSMLTYLDRARERMADTRLRLRKLRGDDAHEGSSNTVDYLKRAREQLMGPTEILQRLLQDQSMLYVQTSAMKGTISVQEEAQPLEIPKWLNTEFLDARQADIQERATEITMRMTAGVERQESKEGEESSSEEDAAQSEDPHGEAGQGTEDDENFQKMIAAAREALPHLNEGLSYMATTRDALKEKRIPEALRSEEEAANSLASALERFADLKQLIEMAYSEQAQIAAFLDPELERHAGGQALAPEEKARRMVKGTRRNQERLERLGNMFAEELVKLEQAAAAAATPGQSPAPAGGGPNAPSSDPGSDPAAMEKQKYELAEQFRSAALAAVDKTKELMENEGTSPAEIKIAAKEALTNVEELRKLFFTLMEHLKQLARDQAETMDMTASASAETTEPEKLAAELMPTVARQNNHSFMAMQIAEALKKQGEQTSKEPAFTQKKIVQTPQGHGQGQNPPDFAKAGEEVAQARENMIDAANGMVAEAPEIEEILDNEKTALEHLNAALMILNPPQEKQDKGDEKKQEQQQGQEEDKQEQKDKEAERKMSKEQAERKLQSIRDKESQRRNREQRESPSETVEKDW